MLTQLLMIAAAVVGLERPGVEYRVFQFPKNQIPRIDGKTDDWEIVPKNYAIGTDQLRETVLGLEDRHDRSDLNVSVKVGWVKGENRLYFLYEASDDYWDFSRSDLHNDIFEIVVDGDLSGGPLISAMHPDEQLRGKLRTLLDFQGVHAQNYHIFTPPRDKDWTMVWGAQPWAKELPFANAAYQYDFQPGQNGKLVLEFFVTPFDHAPVDKSRRIETPLAENKIIGLSWAILDYDDVDSKTYDGFWNLSHKTTMYGNANDLVAFRLMPLEENLRPSIGADWTFKVLNPARRSVAFQDESVGKISSWLWEFGDGNTSTEQHPVHQYQKEGEFLVTLTVTGPQGTARRTKVWDVTLP